MGFLKPKASILSKSNSNKLSSSFRKESFYNTEDVNTLAALIKGKKFKKRDARIYSKLEEYNIDQNNNNLFFSSLIRMYRSNFYIIIIIIF